MIRSLVESPMKSVINPLFLRKPRVALLSTGNELINPTDPMEKGKIRDSNKTTIAALFTEGGFQTIDIGIARDT